MTGNKKRKWPWIVAIVLALIGAAAGVILLHSGQPIAGMPALTVETPRKLSPDTGEFSLDVSVSRLGEALYPAMSMCIAFDAQRLEFLGLRDGNVRILGEDLPQWSCNVESSNATGKIHIMYLDITGGANAFSQSLLQPEDNVLLGLNFRLREGVRPGDVLELVVEDAVFAASDERQSLAMTVDTLKVKNGRIVIGG